MQKGAEVSLVGQAKRGAPVQLGTDALHQVAGVVQERHKDGQGTVTLAGVFQHQPLQGGGLAHARLAQHDDPPGVADGVQQVGPLPARAFYLVVGRGKQREKLALLLDVAGIIPLGVVFGHGGAVAYQFSRRGQNDLLPLDHGGVMHVTASDDDGAFDDIAEVGFDDGGVALIARNLFPAYHDYLSRLQELSSHQLLRCLLDPGHLHHPSLHLLAHLGPHHAEHLARASDSVTRHFGVVRNHCPTHFPVSS